MNPYAIILAGGHGLRAGTDTPKQFLRLNGKMVIQYSLEAFKEALPGCRIILVASALHRHYWEPLLQNTPGFADVQVTDSGTERFFSVRNGLVKIPGNVLVGIHDAARPLISVDLIRTTYRLAADHGCCIPAITPADSIRLLTEKTSLPLPRNTIRLVQTPQVFLSSELKTAYQAPYNDLFTDDAAVWENAGLSVFLCEGRKHNFKITTPDDIPLAGWLLSSNGSPKD